MLILKPSKDWVDVHNNYCLKNHNKFWGHVAASRIKRSHQWCLTLTPNNIETIERMTGHCFLRPIRRDLTSSSYTTEILNCAVCLKLVVLMIKESIYEEV